MDIARLTKCFLVFMLFFSSFATANTALEKTSLMNNDVLGMIEDAHLASDDSIDLDVPFYQQTTQYTCGPAVVMSLMHYFGMLAPKDLNAKTELRIAKEMEAVATEKGGTTLSQMEKWLSLNGFKVDVGQRIDTDTLIENLKNGLPTIIGYQRHWMLAKAYKKGIKPAQDEIIFADSGRTVTIMFRDTLDMMWLQGFNRNSHAGELISHYILAVPDSSLGK